MRRRETVGKHARSGTEYEGDLAAFGPLALDVFPDSTPEEWGL